MKITSLIAVATSALVVASCASKVWYHPNVSAAQGQSDFARCQYEATAYTPNATMYYGSAIGAGLDMALRKQELMGMCIAVEGIYARKQDVGRRISA